MLPTVSFRHADVRCMTPFLADHSTAKSGTTVTFVLFLHDRKRWCLARQSLLKNRPCKSNDSPLSLHTSLELNVATIL